MTIEFMSEIDAALSGATLVWIEATPREVRVGVDGGDVACFRAEADGRCRLARTRQRGGPNGGGTRLYEDFEGRRVVHVTETERRCTLLLGDGEALHLEAVVNEEGCRVATRSELGRGGGLVGMVHTLLHRS